VDLCDCVAIVVLSREQAGQFELIQLLGDERNRRVDLTGDGRDRLWTLVEGQLVKLRSSSRRTARSSSLSTSLLALP